MPTVGSLRHLRRTSSLPGWLEHSPCWVALVLRSGARPDDWGRQTSLAGVLALCATEELSENQARRVGLLAGKSGHDDVVQVAVVQVAVVEGAVRRRDAVVTSNPSHVRSVADALRARIRIATI